MNKLRVPAIVAVSLILSSTLGLVAAVPSAAKTTALTRKYAGTTITVLLPPWGQMPASQLAQFTKETGINVKMEELAWDSIHTKVVTSMAAGVPPADVTEFDWSWVGQFGAGRWYTPLQKLIPSYEVKQSAVASIFTYNHNLLAMPYSLDFRVMLINRTDFLRAGITSIPTNWSQLLNDAKILKAKKVLQYPVGLPYSVTEGASTPWYMLIKSAGGELFGPNWKPLFTSPSSPGGQALQFEAGLYRDHLVPPGEVSLTDLQTIGLFRSGQVAIVIAGVPGFLPSLVNPKSSKVAHDDIVAAPVPGTDGHRTGTFGLPEGLGIPVNSPHKGAAALFIAWWMQTPQQLVAYENPNMGDIPAERYALNTLIQKGQLVDGKELMAILPTVKPLFPQGTPPWYPQFSTDVATMIQSVAEGKSTVAAGLSTLASQVVNMRTAP